MSSTNRSAARAQHVADYYKTPVPAIMDFLMEFLSDNPHMAFDGKFILDPCAGGSGSETMSYPEALQKYTYKAPLTIETIDIREDSPAKHKCDYLATAVSYWPDVIITNPPFNLALPIIKKALVDVKTGGLVIMLLRLNFFGSRERAEWFDKHMPLFCYVHSKRMKFRAGGGTDSIEYMHAVWQKGNYPKFTQLRII